MKPTADPDRRPKAEQKQPKAARRTANDDVLAVIVDQRNGREYYVSLIDTFIFQNQEYTVMYNYEPDDGEHREPEIVIMKTYRNVDGVQYFTSIRRKQELEKVFTIFFDRFKQAE